MRFIWEKLVVVTWVFVFVASTPLFAEKLATNTREICASTTTLDQNLKSRLAEIGWSPLSQDKIEHFKQTFSEGVIIATADATSKVDWAAAIQEGYSFTNAVLDSYEDGEKVSLFVAGNGEFSGLMVMQFPAENQQVLRCIYTGGSDDETDSLITTVSKLDAHVGIAPVNPEFDSVHIEGMEPSPMQPDVQIYTSILIARYNKIPAEFEKAPAAVLGFSTIAATEN